MTFLYDLLITNINKTLVCYKNDGVGFIENNFNDFF